MVEWEFTSTINASNTYADLPMRYICGQSKPQTEETEKQHGRSCHLVVPTTHPPSYGDWLCCNNDIDSDSEFQLLNRHQSPSEMNMHHLMCATFGADDVRTRKRKVSCGVSPVLAVVCHMLSEMNPWQGRIVGISDF